ncbi:hypothetical protein [Loigolactobacillus jiayinensis]|uniref:Uncharacterized protein n=1 Tax=Loigolactobacillus jiayinensis TaxID=2486016 RepID=A0ABW1RBT7_9LACO|nr:hypothetical protein [Loigolactobacillus jiayinensis]
MRNLAFTSDSQQSIKLGDSSDVLSLKVTELNQPVDLSKASSITVKIGNAQGFLTDINVEVSSLKYPTDGIIDVVISSKISSELPAGQYLIEVWIKDAQGNTVIYPDTSYPTVIGFSIKKNIMTATSTVITTITLADFETKFDDMQKDLQDKVTSGYFKGDKGDTGDSAYAVAKAGGFKGTESEWLASLKGATGATGTVDNAGLISAPAFQSLQTQVNNLQVGGQNYLLNSATLRSGWGANLSAKAEIFELITEAGVDNTVLHVKNSLGTAAIGLYQILTHKFEVGKAITQSVMVRGHGQLYLGFGAVNKTFTIDSDAYTKIYLPGIVTDTGGVFKLYANDIGEIWCHSPKIETGNLATDWCLNPSEILTQSDYAKIKAAIVALGGTLS